MTRRRRPRLLGLRAASSALVIATGALAQPQSYPTKPVRIIVPYSPGGSLDLVARVLGKKLGAELGQSAVVENRPGGAGNIGIEVVAKSPPDGHTLLMIPSSITINPSLLRKVPYDTVRDFEPVAKVSSYMLFLVVHPSTRARTVRELIALAKAQPGQVTFASVGVGSATHLAGELFATMAAVKLVHVPYKGSGQVMPDLIGGQVAATFGSTTVVPYVHQRKLVALGVTGARRSEVLPSVPTIAEAGVPGYELTSWNALFAPAGTPSAIVARLNGIVRLALAEPEAKAVMDAQGLEATPSTPEELGQLVRSELAKWAKVIREAGIRGE